uniref:Uncharacterized protein n=1 Tax=Lygus hesperus TaxID=30085 RepID=A0A146LWS9_LYGHE
MVRTYVQSWQLILQHLQRFITFLLHSSLSTQEFLDGIVFVRTLVCANTDLCAVVMREEFVSALWARLHMLLLSPCQASLPQNSNAPTASHSTQLAVSTRFESIYRRELVVEVTHLLILYYMNHSSNSFTDTTSAVCKSLFLLIQSSIPTLFSSAVRIDPRISLHYNPILAHLTAILAQLHL